MLWYGIPVVFSDSDTFYRDDRGHHNQEEVVGLKNRFKNVFLLSPMKLLKKTYIPELNMLHNGDVTGGNVNSHLSVRKS